MSNQSTQPSPYSGLSASAYWRSGVAQSDPQSLDDVYAPKFRIASDAWVATAGSCFAQHIARHMRTNGYQILDVEPPPLGLPYGLRQSFGYSTYSARYGNIYTVKQLRQLTQEVAGTFTPVDAIWEKDGRYFDALRPSVDPNGLESAQEVAHLRRHHINMVRQMFEKLDVLIFTLGLTEMWLHRESGTVYPTAPGTIAGEFDPDKYVFHNAQFNEIVEDFKAFEALLSQLRGGRPFQVLLTVSPVPLTATASGNHILVANTYSKSVLRTVAGYLADNHAHIDYFPSYEIVTNPALRSAGFEGNLRSVRESTVQTVMRHFFHYHPPVNQSETATEVTLTDASEEVQCEDALLEAFGNQ